MSVKKKHQREPGEHLAALIYALSFQTLLSEFLFFFFFLQEQRRRPSGSCFVFILFMENAHLSRAGGETKQ